IIHVMHPGDEMGVKFTQQNPAQNTKVEEDIQTQVNTEGPIPDLQVRPASIHNAASAAWEIPPDSADPLLSLFITMADVHAEAFQLELKKQRGMEVEVSA